MQNLLDSTKTQKKKLGNQDSYSFIYSQKIGLSNITITTVLNSSSISGKHNSYLAAGRRYR